VPAALPHLLVEEANRVLVGHEAPLLAERVQVNHLALGNDVGVQVISVIELRHLAYSTINGGKASISRTAGREQREKRLSNR
jgi:hypothetical protein